MPESYNKDAYEVIYKHKSWKQTVSDYERNFARNLSRAPVVQDAARGALVKLSNMLNAYYGLQDLEKQKNSAYFRDSKYEKVRETTEQTVKGTTPDISNTLEEALLPDLEQEPQNAAGYVRNAYHGSYQIAKDVYERDNISAQPTMEMMDFASRVNRGNLTRIINGGGSLDQQMWLLYNGVNNTGGRDSYTASRSRTLQNMLRGMNEKKYRQMQDIMTHSDQEDLKQASARMDYESFQRLEKESPSGAEIFERAALERPARKAAEREDRPYPPVTQSAAGQMETTVPAKRKGSLFSRFVDSVKRRLGFGGDKKSAAQAAKTPAAKQAADGVQSNEDLQPKVPSEETLLAPGMLKNAEPSVITLRMLGAYRMLGAGKRDLLFFRLALISWLVKGGDHTLYDILEASHQAGLKGSEDLSEAATMYTSLDPLTEQQLRNYAPEKRFPHETVYLMMLNEVKKKRQRVTNTLDKKKAGNLFDNLTPKDRNAGTDENDAFNYDAQEMALNLYTSPAYQVMNVGARDENMENARKLLQELPAAEAYLRSQKSEQEDQELMDEMFDVIRVSSRLSLDALAMRGTVESDQTSIDTVNDRQDLMRGDSTKSSQGKASYRGVTFRGGGIWKNLEGGKGDTFITESLTSTTQDAETAAVFYMRSPRENRAFVRYNLAGKGAVRINDMSQYQDETEVLLPIGTVLRIKHELADAYYKKGSVREMNYKEELSQNDRDFIENNEDKIWEDKDFQFASDGDWVKVRMVELEEVSGPGEQRRQQLEKGKNKNMKKAQDLEKYRLRLKNRQAGKAS